MKKFLALNLSDVVSIVLINVKMPTIVGILTFMCRINWKEFYNLEVSCLSSLVNHAQTANFNVAEFSFNAIHENKILAIFFNLQ